MLFLRLSWSVTEGGIGQAIRIVQVATVITSLTALFLSAISTNEQIKGGGDAHSGGYLTHPGRSSGRSRLLCYHHWFWWLCSIAIDHVNMKGGWKCGLYDETRRIKTFFVCSPYLSSPLYQYFVVFISSSFSWIFWVSESSQFLCL